MDGRCLMFAFKDERKVTQSAVMDGRCLILAFKDERKNYGPP